MYKGRQAHYFAGSHDTTRPLVGFSHLGEKIPEPYD
jgi:hypothetical protein